MKKNFLKFTLLVLLVLTLAATLSACGDKSKETATSAPPAKAETTKAAATKAPTVAPTLVPTEAPTVVPTKAPTVAPTAQPQAVETVTLEKVDASSAKIKAELARLKSYQFDVTTRMAVKLKDGSEKAITMKITTIVVNKPKPANKVTFHVEGGGADMAQMNGFEAISVGDQGWIKMGTDANWMAMPASTVAQMTDSFHQISSGASDIAFAEKDLKKGTKRVGSLKCTLYEYNKNDILRLAKKYPEHITDADIAELTKWTHQKGTVCLTKAGLPLMFSMEVSGPPSAMGTDAQFTQDTFGVPATDVKEINMTVAEEVSNINKSFDIKPPETGG